MSAALVGMLVGSISTMRMSQGASSCRSASAIVAMALLDAEIGPVNGGVNRVPIEPIITIRPRASRSKGKSAWVTASGPVTLTFSWRWNCSIGMISSGPNTPMPALFTSPVSPVPPVSAGHGADGRADLGGIGDVQQQGRELARDGGRRRRGVRELADPAKTW